MRSVSRCKKYIALATILIFVVSTAVIANGVRVTPAPPSPAPVAPPPPTPAPTVCPDVPCGVMPGMAGAGPRVPTACAASVGQSAYLYVCEFRTSTPTAVTGSMQMSVADTARVPSLGPDRASAVATFTYPATGGSNYRVEFTSVDTTTDFGGVALLQPVFGEAGACAGYDLPETLAYAVAVGNVTIMRDGTTIATNQPALAAVTQALHGPNRNWLASPNPDEQEIHLIVPGSMSAGGSAIPGFETGTFYIYWPSAAFELRNIGGTVEAMPGTVTPGTARPGAPARGPAASNQPIGTISMSLTNDSIQKAIGSAPSGLYVVQIMNNSSRSRGLVLRGTDLAGNNFLRFVSMLNPGQSTSFQFFFAPGKVTIRDFLSAQRTGTVYSNVKYGPLSSSIVFQ